MEPKKARPLAVVFAPLALLVLLVGGLRFLPALTAGSDRPEDDAPPPDPITRPRRPHRPPPSPAPPPKPVDAATQRALETTVTGQVDAFHRNDYVAALGFSEEEFRRHWRPEAFRSMIQAQYAPLTTAEKKVFTPALWHGSIATLPLTVQNEAGIRTTFVFILQATKNGSGWCITGCEPALAEGFTLHSMPMVHAPDHSLGVESTVDAPLANVPSRP